MPNAHGRLFATLFACIFAGAVLAQGTFPSPNLPPPPGTYISPQLFHILFANGIIIDDPSHDKFQPTTPPPPPGGTQIHNFSSIIRCNVELPSGARFPVFMNCVTVVRVHGNPPGPDPTVRTFDTEMLALNGSFTMGGMTWMIRESPSRPSRGQTNIRALSTGEFRIDSFFDIFTELSMDGGASWIPSTNAGRMKLTRGGCPGGDINGDGMVDDIDLAIVLSTFGTNDPRGDVNADGVVDDTDLAIVLADFGLSC